MTLASIVEKFSKTAPIWRSTGGHTLGRSRTNVKCVPIAAPRAASWPGNPLRKIIERQWLAFVPQAHEDPSACWEGHLQVQILWDAVQCSQHPRETHEKMCKWGSSRWGENSDIMQSSFFFFSRSHESEEATKSFFLVLKSVPRYASSSKWSDDQW